MQQSTTGIALAFMAHPDDAEFLCAGTLIRLRRSGWEVHIATCTAGDCGTATQSPWAISAKRTEEAAQAAALIGASYHCLGELDGFVVYDKEALRKAYDLFRRIAPTLVFTHSPQDYMRDHEEAALIARAASFLYAAPNCSSVPLKPGSTIPYLYFCDPIEGKDHRGRTAKPDTYVDISGVLEEKRQMLMCHESQRSWLLEHHGVDEYLHMMERHAAFRGSEIGVAAAEAFLQFRAHGYPAEDLLKKLFGEGA